MKNHCILGVIIFCENETMYISKSLITSKFNTDSIALFRKLALICLVWVFFLSGLVIAQGNNLKFTNYTIDEGLSNNYVHAICQDSHGWMWFGTYYGLNRFDGFTFHQYHPEKSDSASLKGRLVRDILEAKDGNLWIATDEALNRYNREMDNFTAYSLAQTGIMYELPEIEALEETGDGRIWIGTPRGLFFYDKKEDKLFSHKELFRLAYDDIAVYSLLSDAQENLWIGTSMGVIRVNLSTNSVAHFNILSKDSEELKVNEIRVLYMDSEQTIWAGSYLGGLNSFNSSKSRFEHIAMPEEGIKHRTVRDVIEFEPGIFFVATRDGIFKYEVKSGQIFLIKNNPYENSSLINNSVWRLFKDSNGNLWVATRGGISYLNRNVQAFSSFGAFPDDDRFLNSSEIWSMLEDSKGRIWIGTENGGVNIFDRKKERFTYLTTASSELTTNNIKSFCEDSNGDIWIGTFMGGLYCSPNGSRNLINYKHDKEVPGSLCDNEVWSIYEDSKQRLWIGTSEGLDMWNPETRTFIHYADSFQVGSVHFIMENSRGEMMFASEEDPMGVYDQRSNLFNEYPYYTRIIHEDQSGNFWLGSIGEGLIKLDSEYRKVASYTTEEGLCDNTIFGILEKNSGYLWLSTMNGLSRFEKNNESFWNFNKQDGLKNNKYNYNAFCMTRQGEMVFGGNSGFDIFNPDQIRRNEYVPPLVYTNLKIDNEIVGIGEEIDGSIVLYKKLNQTDELHLTHKHAIVSIEYAALNYASSIDNRYAYYLEGFEESWLEIGNQRSITFTKLKPGWYNLHLKGSNNDGVWNEEYRSLGIYVKPPMVKTLWFKIIMFLVILTIIFFLMHYIINREKLKNQIIFERAKAKKIHELDLMKFKLFTNISHELRTPLTLILSPLERMISGNVKQEEYGNHLRLMQRNGKRMMSLINQLLDFRKLEAGKLKLDYTFGNIVPFLKELVTSFMDLAKERKIEMGYESVMDQINLWYDPEKIEMVMYNLLSNAFKFTPANGHINVRISLIMAGKHEEKGKYAQVIVEDSGKGIPKSQLKKIFDRFYHDDQHQTFRSSGTGIGLALSRDLIKMHKGQILVNSEEGKGSRFEILLPYTKEKPGMEKPDIHATSEYESQIMGDIQLEKVVEADAASEKPILLIVEDNQELLDYIRSFLSVEYKIVEAYDGKTGWEKVLQFIPDIIITDIMMPETDGKELTRNIKNDERTCHIPVVILTALASKEHEKEGFLAGANAYISKPFEPEVLRIRLQQILKDRKKLKERYMEFLQTGKGVNISQSPDDKFIRKALEVVNRHLDDQDFDTEAFSREIGISRTQLYRKFNSVLNITINDFIKQLRLKKAAELLLQEEYNVSEVAYKVGFKEVSYFRKCFKKLYKYSPSEYKAMANGNMSLLPPKS